MAVFKQSILSLFTLLAAAQLEAMNPGPAAGHLPYHCPSLRLLAARKAVTQLPAEVLSDVSDNEFAQTYPRETRPLLQQAKDLSVVQQWFEQFQRRFKTFWGTHSYNYTEDAPREFELNTIFIQKVSRFLKNPAEKLAKKDKNWLLLFSWKEDSGALAKLLLGYGANPLEVVSGFSEEALLSAANHGSLAVVQHILNWLDQHSIANKNSIIAFVLGHHYNHRNMPFHIQGPFAIFEPDYYDIAQYQEIQQILFKHIDCPITDLPQAPGLAESLDALGVIDHGLIQGIIRSGHTAITNNTEPVAILAALGCTGYVTYKTGSFLYKLGHELLKLIMYPGH